MSVPLRRTLLIAAAGVLVAIGCAAPVLPLPPPVMLVEAPDAAGNVAITGEARPGAFVACLNENTEVGVIVRADPATGAFATSLPADVGHEIRGWQFESTDGGGQPVFRIVPAP